MASEDFPVMHSPYQSTTMDLDAEARVHCDGSYFLEPRGLMRLGEVVVAFVGYCIILATHLSNFLIGEYICGVIVAGMCVTAIFFGVYLFHFVRAYRHFPWLQIEFGANALLTASYIAAAVLTTYVATGNDDFISCAVISLIQVILYGADTFISFALIKTNKHAASSSASSMYLRAASEPA
ncbi:uncharacterized protein LOC124161072 [Ischnura elegans]|uniref:uncharacterized protein LOC124161072 n=1 Tax=Ischnura elegans TaxID=197161 RepID=UPI001ED89841|nr:uncharacterized protein LOC124161072 [Ischnura elegans]